MRVYIEKIGRGFYCSLILCASLALLTADSRGRAPLDTCLQEYCHSHLVFQKNYDFLRRNFIFLKFNRSPQILGIVEGSAMANPLRSIASAHPAAKFIFDPISLNPEFSWQPHADFLHDGGFAGSGKIFFFFSNN